MPVLTPTCRRCAIHNMAAVVSLMAKDRGTPKIKYQVLLWPVTNANFENAVRHSYIP